MTRDDEHGPEQLRAVLHAHTIDAPDADAVHLGIRTAITRRRKQRQVTQAAGVAIVVGGLAIAIPVFGRNDNGHTGTTPTITTPLTSGSPISSTAPPSPSPAKKPSDLAGYPSAPAGPPAHSDDQLAAFFGAGYQFDDAESLTRYWNMPLDDYYTAKVLGGQILNDGGTLPFSPGGTAAPVASTSHAVDAQDAFLTSHDKSDAKQLMSIWHETDLSLTKILAGQMVLDGVKLPTL